MIIQGNDPYTQPSFSLGNRMARALWGVTWLLLFRPSPPPFHAWRRLLLRVFGARLGKQVHVYPNVKIWAPWLLTIGDFVGIANGVNLYNMSHITIGDYAVISQGAYLCGGSHDYNTSNFQLIAKPITVGQYAWVCADVFIGLGVTVPEGAVVGARSVVTKSLVQSWVVYAGNPCRQVGVRKQNVKGMGYD